MTHGNATDLGLILRLLLAVGSVLCFAAPRQLAQGFGVPPAPFTGQLPTAPPNEEDESGREGGAKEAAKESAADPRHGRRTDRPPPRAGFLPADRDRRARPHSPVAYPSRADPFRNGLGTPYRC